jgi:hypothetical protein
MTKNTNCNNDSKSSLAGRRLGVADAVFVLVPMSSYSRLGQYTLLNTTIMHVATEYGID